MIKSLFFPFGLSEFSLVFATASYQSVRVWSLKQKHELLRIVVPNFSAAAVVFSFNGLSIITAWNDGAIRAFTPLTGKLIYAIPNAHNKGISISKFLQALLPIAWTTSIVYYSKDARHSPYPVAIDFWYPVDVKDRFACGKSKRNNRNWWQFWKSTRRR